LFVCLVGWLVGCLFVRLLFQAESFVSPAMTQ
jgi:hypothetical protein